MTRLSETLLLNESASHAFSALDIQLQQCHDTVQQRRDCCQHNPSVYSVHVRIFVAPCTGLKRERQGGIMTVQRRTYTNEANTKSWHLIAVNNHIYVFTNKLTIKAVVADPNMTVEWSDVTVTTRPGHEEHALVNLAACENTIEIRRKGVALLTGKNGLKTLANITDKVVGPFNTKQARAVLWAGIMLQPRLHEESDVDVWVQTCSATVSPFDNLCNMWHRPIVGTTADDDDDEPATDDAGDDMLQITETRKAPFVPEYLKSSIALCSAPIRKKTYSQYLATSFAITSTDERAFSRETAGTAVDEEVSHTNAYWAYSQMQHLPVQVASLASALGTSVHMQLGFLMETKFPDDSQKTNPVVRAGASSILAPLAAAVANEAYNLVQDGVLVSNELCAAIPFLTQGDCMFGAFPDGALEVGNTFSSIELKTRWRYTAAEISQICDEDDSLTDTSLPQNQIQTCTQAVATGMMHNAKCDATLLVAYIPKEATVSSVTMAKAAATPLANVRKLYKMYAGLLTRSMQLHAEAAAKSKYAEAYTDKYMHVYTQSAAMIAIVNCLYDNPKIPARFVLLRGEGVTRAIPSIFRAKPFGDEEWQRFEPVRDPNKYHHIIDAVTEFTQIPFKVNKCTLWPLTVKNVSTNVVKITYAHSRDANTLRAPLFKNRLDGKKTGKWCTCAWDNPVLTITFKSVDEFLPKGALKLDYQNALDFLGVPYEKKDVVPALKAAYATAIKKETQSASNHRFATLTAHDTIVLLGNDSSGEYTLTVDSSKTLAETVMPKYAQNADVEPVTLDKSCKVDLVWLPDIVTATIEAAEPYQAGDKVTVTYRQPWAGTYEGVVDKSPIAKYIKVVFSEGGGFEYFDRKTRKAAGNGIDATLDLPTT